MSQQFGMHLELTFIIELLQINAENAQALWLERSTGENDTSEKPFDWPLFMQLLFHHRLWHQAQQALSFMPAVLPPAQGSRLEKRCQRNRLKIISTTFETARIAQLFNQFNVLYCVIKGVVLNTLLYESLYSRPCRDIDIWVHPDDYQQAMRHLMSLGYEKTHPTYALDAFKERYYLAHKHDMIFYHPKRCIVLELHFRLSYCGLDCFVPVASMLKPVEIVTVPVVTLQDDWHLLYLMIHGASHGWVRLRWLHDILLFINSNRCDLNHVLSLAKEIDCEHVVQQACLLLQRTFRVQHDTLALLTRHPSRRVLTLTRLAQAFIMGSYDMNDGLSNVSLFLKYRYYLFLLAVKGQKAKTMLGDAFKLDVLFPYVTFPEKLSFLYVAVYPIWVINYVGQSCFRRLFKVVARRLVT